MKKAICSTVVQRGILIHSWLWLQIRLLPKQDIVKVGEILPEHVHTQAIFVDYLIKL